MTQIGNVTGGGGDTVTATGTSITINGETTTLDGRTQAQVQAEIDSRVAASALNASIGMYARVDNGKIEYPRNAYGQIQSVANGSGGKVVVTSASHGLANGDSIVIAGSTDYNGTFAVSDVAADTFQIVATWTQTRTGTWTCAANKYYSGRRFKGRVEYLKTAIIPATTDGAFTIMWSEAPTSGKFGTYTEVRGYGRDGTTRIPIEGVNYTSTLGIQMRVSENGSNADFEYYAQTALEGMSIECFYILDASI